MGIEMSASRLLRPFFGDSILIWANIIGLIMIYLTLGYWVGGRWADRDARGVTLYRIVAWAGMSVGLIPFIARPLLNLAIPALEKFDAGMGFTSFAGTLVLFFIPVTLLGFVSPFAIRLSARDLATTGSTSGNLYALSTFGSILGVFGTVFFLLATIGTRNTFLVYGFALMVSAISGIAIERDLQRAARYALLPLTLVLLLVLMPGGVTKPVPGLVYESESFFNFIQVVDDPSGWRLLTVNEGQAYQSAYRPDRVLTGGIWDLFLIAPYFSSSEPPKGVLMIGLAAGTIAREYTLVYPNIPIDGIELDPAIIATGQKYFAMTEPNLHPIAADGRSYLERKGGVYDVIAVDAYRQPYIPFHLTTVEFFGAVRDHLTAHGVVALNAARTRNDYRLVDSLAATMRQVFPSVYLVDHPNNANTLVVATREPTQLDVFEANAGRLEDPSLKIVSAQALSSVRTALESEPIFTDDHAPVENLIDDIILRYALGQ